MIESYRKEGLARRLTYGDVANVQGIWTPRQLEMRDVQRNSRTILRLEKLQYDVSVREEDFTPQALRRD